MPRSIRAGRVVDVVAIVGNLVGGIVAVRCSTGFCTEINAS